MMITVITSHIQIPHTSNENYLHPPIIETIIDIIIVIVTVVSIIVLHRHHHCIHRHVTHHIDAGHSHRFRMVPRDILALVLKGQLAEAIELHYQIELGAIQR